MQTTYSILTAYGRNKEAECIANGTPLVLTEIAFGDGDRIPAGGEISLQNELVRKPIAARGVVEGTPNASYFDALLEAADGPYVIREGGLFDDTGGMVAIVKYDPVVNKPIAASGQSAEAQMRMVVAFTDLQNLILQINAIGSYVPSERRIETDDGVGGGGDLSEDRTFKLAVQDLDEISGDQVSEAQGNIDWIPLRDSSAGNHKKLRPSELALALGVQDKINTSLAEHLADIPETKAGEINNKAVHPEGLHAALAEKLGGGFNVRSFEHANDSNAPTAQEWGSPFNGDKALVSNASDDSWALYQRRANAWVLLSNSGGAGLENWQAAASPLNLDKTKSWQIYSYCVDTGAGQPNATFQLEGVHIPSSSGTKATLIGTIHKANASNFITGSFVSGGSPSGTAYEGVVTPVNAMDIRYTLNNPGWSEIQVTFSSNRKVLYRELP